MIPSVPRDSRIDTARMISSGTLILATSSASFGFKGRSSGQAQAGPTSSARYSAIWAGAMPGVRERPLTTPLADKAGQEPVKGKDIAYELSLTLEDTFETRRKNDLISFRKRWLRTRSQ